MMPNNNWNGLPQMAPVNNNWNQPVAQQSFPQSNPGSIMTIFVNSEDEVLNYPVAAGLTVMLVDFNHKKFYLKSTGVNSVPQPLRKFPFEEEVVQTPQIPMASNGTYVSREEFSALNSKLDKLISELGGTKNE